ncbi:MAG: VanZ family protein [Steroidobacteraceae bacterium]
MASGRKAAFLGTLVVALPALALVAKMPSHPQILAVLNNAAHAPVFGALAVVWLLLLREVSPLGERHRFAVALAATIAIGGLVELIQPAIGRGGEWVDLLNDTLGAIAGLALAAALSSRRRWAALIFVVAAAPVLWPVAEASIAYAARAWEFPTMLGGDTRADRYFVRTRGVQSEPSILPPRWSQAGDPPSLRIQIVGGNWPGITHSEPQPDWSDYSKLMLDMTNPESRPLKLTLRVHDRMHDNRSSDRFNRTFTLAAAQRSILAIPLSEIASGPEGRSLDLSRVAGVILFGEGSPQQVGQVFYITRIWLE